MRYRLHMLLIALALLASVVVFDTAMATSSSLAMKDALLKRLEGPARREIRVVVPEEFIQAAKWPTRIVCGSVAFAVMCLVVVLVVRRFRNGRRGP